MKWLRTKLRNWLGITALEDTVQKLNDELFEHRAEILKLHKWTENVVDIGVDVHFKSPHKIWIFTKIGGGQVREIDVNFENLRELTDLVRHLKDRYRSRVEFDIPPGDMRGFIHNELGIPYRIPKRRG